MINSFFGLESVCLLPPSMIVTGPLVVEDPAKELEVKSEKLN